MTREKRIQKAFAGYLHAPGEPSRLAAVELGQHALTEGVTLLEWLATVYGVIAATAPGSSSSAAHPHAAAAHAFLLDCVSGYDAGMRGMQDANAALHRQVESMEAEAARIARELHDIPGQLLASAYMEAHLGAHRVPEASSSFEKITLLLGQVHSNLRRFAQELRPTVLDDLGLMPALRALGQTITSRGDLAVTVEGDTHGRLAPPVEVALYRAAEAALTNAVKHSGAAHAEVRVERRPNEVRCTVTDDGNGFPESDSQPSLGLVGVRQRIEPLGGSIRWGSIPSSRGSVVVATVPLN